MAHALRDRHATTSMALGALGSAFAFALVLRSAFPQLALGRGFADAVEPGIHAALILLLLGAALCLRAFPDTHRPAQAAASLLALAAGLYSVLALWSALAGPGAGTDLPGFITGGGFRAPGVHSLSPHGGVAFLACAAALWCAAPARSTGHRRAGRMALALLATVATLGLAGHLMGLELLYRAASHNQVRLSTAVALLVLGAGIWQLRDRGPIAQARDPQWLERRITYRAITALTLVAVGGGIAGFVAMRETFEKSVLQAMEQSARTYALALDDALRSSLALSAAAGDGPALAQAMARLNASPSDTLAREQLDTLTAGFLVGGVDGVRFLDARGHLVRSTGLFLGDGARSIEALDLVDGSQQAELRWNAGYLLRTLVPVRQGGAVVGQVVMEQKLRLFDRLMEQMRRSTESADAVVCRRRADVAACAPSRLYPTPFTVPLWTAAGKPSLPMSLALLGQSGVNYARDLRGVPVVAGYGPIGSSGLGLVLKTDVTTLYAPLRGQLHLIALSVLGLVAAGTWALRGRVRPLLATLVQEQQRSADILSTAGDAFIAVGADGRVTDWNPEAARMFGWSAAEAIGRDMVALLGPRLPPHAPLADHAQLLDLGRSQAPGRPTELLGRHRNGSEVPVEMMMAVQATASGTVANAFLRDIRARRAAEQRLARSEQRLRDVLCNLPAVVCHFDARQRCLFANDYALQSRGLIAHPQVGLYAQELLGDVQYALHLPYLLEALAGRRAQFEGCVDHEGTQRHLQSHLIPEFDAAGDGEGSAPPAVVGFYLMSFDVTALKELQLRHERTERRLRAIADNLPVMITYIDRAHRLQFLNHTFEEWTGLPIEQALGKPLPEVIGPALYAQRADPLRRALSGQRVQFEVESEALGVRRILQTDYIPDMQAVGEVLGIYTLTTDVTAIRQSERRMQELAMTDTLTGVANRRQFDIHLAAALQASQAAGSGMALMFLDIDHFKAINDTWGHAAGDAALLAMAERLQGAVRSTDFPARIAGDEFAVVLPHLSSCDEAQTVADKVLQAIRQPLPQHPHRPRQMSASIGVAYLAPGEQPVRPSDLLLAADRALYAAKHGGRDACAVHVVDLRELG